MKAHDLFELTGRNLREAFLRNSLTTLGISVGVASLVAMLALGVGLQTFATRQLGRSGLFDSVIVSSRQDFRSQEDRHNNPDEKSGDFKPLDEAARKQIEKIAHVTEAYPDIRSMAQFKFTPPNKQEPATYSAVLAALPPSAKTAEGADEIQGSYFSSPTAAEALVLPEFARELLGLKNPKPTEDQKLTEDQSKQLIGREMTLLYAERIQPDLDENPLAAYDPTAFNVVKREKAVKIVGIVPKEPNGAMRAMRGRVFVPTAFAESLNMVQPADIRSIMRPGQGKTYMSLIVRVDRSVNVNRVQDAIKKLGFGTFSIIDASKSIGNFFRILDSFLAVFGSLALGVASLGIINTLVMAILERRREIGIMKAIGASDMDVKKIFFVEAGAMGLLGGALGVALGWIIGRTINFGLNIWLERQDIRPERLWAVPWWLIAAAIGFSIVISLLAGIYPASRAARLDPIQALRHD